LKCDILVPAALEMQITGANAPRLRCRILAEGANGPTTPEAERILADRGVEVVPDVLANAGGVIVSYLEWIQNTQNVSWERLQVDAELSRRLVSAGRDARARAAADGCSLRQGAYRVAVERVARAVRLRGYV
jgi:glutamate dehydrogenase/leucine dehydrogenase